MARLSAHGTSQRLDGIPTERPKGAPKKSSRGVLRRKRRSAAAAALDVRVIELEARSVLALDEVDLGRLEILKAQGVDVELYAVRLELLVHLADLVFEVEVVAEPCASPSDDAKPKPLSFEVLGGSDVLDLGGSLLGDRNHLPASIGSLQAPRQAPSPRLCFTQPPPRISSNAPPSHATRKLPGPDGASPAKPADGLPYEEEGGEPGADGIARGGAPRSQMTSPRSVTSPAWKTPTWPSGPAKAIRPEPSTRVAVWTGAKIGAASPPSTSTPPGITESRSRETAPAPSRATRRVPVAVASRT